MEDTLRTIIVLSTMLLGVVVSFLFPYVRKLILENKIEQIDLKYVVHLITTAIWEFLFGFAIYSQWQPASNAINEVLLYILAFAFGFGGSELQKEIEKIINALRRPQETTNTTDPSLP